MAFNDHWSAANGIYYSNDNGKNYWITEPVIIDGTTYGSTIHSGTVWDSSMNPGGPGWILRLDDTDPGNHAAPGTDIFTLGTWLELDGSVWRNQPIIEHID